MGYVVLLVLPLWNAAWAGPGAKPPAAAEAPLRLGVTTAIVYDRYELIEDWRVYLQRRLQRPVQFVTRDGYAEIMELLKQKRIDVAWLSPSAYVSLQRLHRARLLATPIYQGRPYSRAYLVVAATDERTAALTQLQGKVFAYGDAESFAGYRLPRFELQQAGLEADHFFRKAFVTVFDRHVVEAVAAGLADAGMVDRFDWDTLSAIQPSLVAALRVAAMSAEYGFAPLVARSDLRAADAQALRRVLTHMAADAQGAALLRRLDIDGFVADDPRLYDSVARTLGRPGAP
ncbi:MAG: PhnD/SsuA/transferrin family substrate-binding protein [Rhodocyclaceae bacterium]|nr:PhnD/SsuA/transferrin family substrate-binding protein [Rhodocyclaceae bacterium]